MRCWPLLLPTFGLSLSLFLSFSLSLFSPSLSLLSFLSPILLFFTPSSNFSPSLFTLSGSERKRDKGRDPTGGNNHAHSTGRSLQRHKETLLRRTTDRIAGGLSTYMIAKSMMSLSLYDISIGILILRRW